MNRQSVIASVGAGRMGRGIAISFALAGYEVRLIDVKERSLAEFESLQASASSDIRSSLVLLSAIGWLAANTIDELLARVIYFSKSDCAAAIADVDMIFEAVPETLEAKEVALRLVSGYASSTAIVASTTSTILSDQLQMFVEQPARFLNVHWLNPAFLIPLVEISPGRLTDRGVVERTKTLLETMGKVPVVCKASPGYIVPRIQALAMNEAARLVEEGVASVEDIDKATRYGIGFRFSILGLLEFIDWGGGDILYYASQYMVNATGNQRFAPPAIIESNMKQGHIGLSTQKGFLDYSTIDVGEYQREKLAEFISMLRHIGMLPIVSTERSAIASAAESKNVDATLIVQQFLTALDGHDLKMASQYVAMDFSASYPGGRKFSNLSDLLNWRQSRYRTIKRMFEHIDQSQGETAMVIYCLGSQDIKRVNERNSKREDQSRDHNARFANRFVVVNSLICSLEVFEEFDQAESI